MSIFQGACLFLSVSNIHVLTENMGSGMVDITDAAVEVHARIERLTSLGDIN